MEQLKIRFNKKKIKFAFWLTFIATFPAFLLSVSYDTLPDYATNIAFAAGIIQLIGIVIYFTEFLPFLDDLTIDKNFTQRMLLYVSSISLLLKFVLQAASGLNKTNHIVFINRDIVIGYIHLVTLGFVTCGLLFWLLSQRLIRIKSGFEIFGIHSFVTGFVITEILLFIQVLNELLDLSKIPYRLILFIFSAVMLLGLITFWIAQFSHKDLRER